MKVIASSVERLLRYADVVSNEFLKTLSEDGCQSNGPPVIQACDLIFIWYGHNGGFF